MLNNSILYEDRNDGKLIPRLVVPKVVKNDIRLQYAQMFANVYNACDYNWITAFLQRHFRPDYVIAQELIGERIAVT